MEPFKIIADSSCDLSREQQEKYNVDIVPFNISLNGTDYFLEGVDITAQEFYRSQRAGNISGKTSLPSITQYTDVFFKYLSKGLDILCICLSSGLSGSYQSAVNASNILKADYPNRKIIVVDSQLATGAQASLVISAVALRDKNEPIDLVAKKLIASIDNSGAIFTIDSLDYLHHGGRIRKSVAIAGTLLNIKPIISLKNGVLTVVSKVRGRKKAINDMVQSVMNITEISEYNFTIIHADCYNEALDLQNILLNEYHIPLEYPIATLSTTIGTHTGPTLIGIGYNVKIK